MKYKGSITIFACVTMLMVSQVLLVLLEASRRSFIQRCADSELRAGLESVFSSYSTPLWEEYQILGWDETRTDMAEIIASIDEYEHATPSTDLLRVEKDGECKVKRILLTDGGGLSFENAVIAYMKLNAVGEILRRVEENSKNIKKLESGKSGTMEYYLSSVESAKKAIESHKKKNENGGHDIVFHGVKNGFITLAAEEEQEPSLEDMEGPIDLMLSTFKNGFAGYIISRANSISQLKVDKNSLLSKRTLKEGNGYLERDISVIDRMLFLEYIYSRFGCYRNEKDNRALSYEWEYILNGFDSDLLNINATLVRLLLVRMAANMVSIVEDEAKMNEADLYGGILAGLVLEPELKDLFKASILSSWVYAESVLDLRTICKGNKVALIKEKADWTINSYLLASAYLIGNKSAKKNDAGLGYEDYLKAMLFLKQDHYLSMRAMDMQEQSIRLLENRQTYCLDNIVCEVSVTQEYKANAVFLPLVPVICDEIKGYRYTSQQKYSYWKSK